MRYLLLICVSHLLLALVSGFWDDGTSTPEPFRTDLTPRQSFFRWQYTKNRQVKLFFPGLDWNWMWLNRRTVVVGGLSIDFLCLGTAVVLNRRTLITAANLLDPYNNRQLDLRIWLLGNAGYHITPYRYRVWRVTRLFPKSLNPEHWHGPRGVHSPRHDISIVHSLDQMYVLTYLSVYGMYPKRANLAPKHQALTERIWMAGSGFEYLQHIKENYKIFWHNLDKKDIVDCSKYLPKWWGKFICMVNTLSFPGVQNGMGFYSTDDWDNRVHYITALGCFEIRYNEDRIMVFTDLRYYVDWITLYAYVWSGQYYEYAYPQWGITIGLLWNTMSANEPNIPLWQMRGEFYPLG